MDYALGSYSQDEICQRQTLAGSSNRYYGYAFLDPHPIDYLKKLALDVRFKNFASRLENANAKYGARKSD